MKDYVSMVEMCMKKMILKKVCKCTHLHCFIVLSFYYLLGKKNDVKVIKYKKKFK